MNHPHFFPHRHPLHRLVLIFMAALALAVLGLLATNRLAPPAQAADSSPLFDPYPSWYSDQVNNSQVAWGDMNGDGYLDLATDGGVYLNIAGKLQTSPAWVPDVFIQNSTIAWGDVNGDGLLDLAIASEPIGSYHGTVQIYLNVDGMLQAAPSWEVIFTSPAASTQELLNARRNADVNKPNDVGQSVGLAWGDMNGDGFLDLAVSGLDASTSQYKTVIYVNMGGVLQTTPAWTLPSGSASIAWGDVNKDGLLDLYTGIGLYLNVGGMLQTVSVWTSPFGNDINSVTFVDVNQDGYLDLALDTSYLKLYMNVAGVLQTTPVYTGSDNAQSLSWADINGDSFPDLALVSDSAKVYLNLGGILQTTPIWSSADTGQNKNVAWGDVNGDGALDLAVGSYHAGQTKIYLNLNATLQSSSIWNSTENYAHLAAAWGDINGDNQPDLAYGPPNRVFLNAGGTLQTIPFWASEAYYDYSYYTSKLAWGDMNGDGLLDLAVAGSFTKVYLNTGITLQTAPVWSVDVDRGTILAWGDMNGDGLLDLAVVGDGFAEIFCNHSGSLQNTPCWAASDSGIKNNGVAWGDMNGDGLLDLAVAGSPTKVYLNVGGALETTSSWSADDDSATSLAWGDMNGDGALDLAVGYLHMAVKVYINKGGSLQPTPNWKSSDTSSTTNLAWGDLNGDGTLDLAASGAPARVYLNQDGTLQTEAAWMTQDHFGSTDVALGDVNGDGALDLAVTNKYQPNKLYLNTRSQSPSSLPLTTVRVLRPGPQADFYSDPHIWTGPTIPISYTISNSRGDHARTIIAWYSPDGGGLWLPAVPVSGTQTANLAPGSYVFNWDVYASGFFGQSDNVVFRMQVVPEITSQANSIPGPYLFGAYASSTFPFRVRGTQIRVMNGSSPARNALVYRLPLSQSGAAHAISDLSQTPYRTDNLGYLQGRGEIKPGDKLVAMLPISSTVRSSLYFTNATPNPNGLDMFTVASSGVQTLTVSSAHPLVLFNLKVSLEWDARQDTKFLEQLHFDLQRTSELLFQWTSGQAALGQITLYHDQQHWADADVRIYATNRRRPAATLGGIASSGLVDKNNKDLVYQPGMVHIGKVWNRYGDPASATGEDWPRALAHELGHYALFLDDDYLGLDSSGRLISIDTCVPTAMTDPYRDDFSQFKHSTDWLPGCQNTLANKTTGRPDWSTITTFYPALIDNPASPRPSSLPLAVTQISEVAPINPPQALPDPRFYLKDEQGASLQPGSSARAFLFRNDRLVDLGGPVVDSVLAPGAQPGDHICVSEPSTHRIGCKTVQPGDDQQLTPALHPEWQPDVVISPQNAHTINLRISGLAAGLPFSARLFSGDGLASPALPLTPSGSAYTAVFSLTQPTTDGFVLIWQTDNDQHVALADYAMDGSPTHIRSGFTHIRSGFAPAMSSDGQVILYTDNLAFPNNEFYTLQAATTLPAPPLWASLVGQAYWLTKSSGAPPLSGASLSMGYRAQAVHPGEEAWLKVYRWDQASTTWVALDSRLNAFENSVVAVIPGPGLYVLMSTVEIPLSGPGWELFSYPIQTTSPVSEALQSIAGSYNLVYWYDSSTPTDTWKLFAPLAPAWVNDLASLNFGRVYWINLTQSVTLKLKGSAPHSASPLGAATPPATFYGRVLSSPGFKPTPGLTVTAWIDGLDCGSGKIRLVDGQVVYTIHVSADGPDTPGCGRPGRSVLFQVGSQLRRTPAAWSSDQVCHVDIGSNFIFLPLMKR